MARVTRNEAAVAALAVVAAAALAAAVTVWQHWLAVSQLSNGASNLLGILAGPTIVAAIATRTWGRWHDRCATPRCVRRGKHPVDGCTAAVCDHHHTEDDHRAAYAARRVEGGLGWGESHRR